MDKNRKRFIWINIIIFIFMVAAVTSTLIFGSRATRIDGGALAGITELIDNSFAGVKISYWHHIVSFTILSNIFLGIIALIAGFLAAKNPKKEVSKGLSTWYLVACSSGMLTVLTVIFFLAPMRAVSGKNYFDMLLEQMFFLHFLNPVLATINYIFFMNKEKTELKPRLLAILPPVIYAAPYIFCVCIIKVWPDFYGLTFGGNNWIIPIIFALMCAIMFGISSLISFLHNRFSCPK